jgi:glycosyltransferase involved in cell wall biosynthesis
MVPDADVCLIIEGGYPYQLGGVASWADALIRALPNLKFHVIAITIRSHSRKSRFQFPDNLVGVTDVILDVCPAGRVPKRNDEPAIARGIGLLRRVLTVGDKDSFCELSDLLRSTGLGQIALLDSKYAWTAMEKVYSELLPDGSLIDFFWSWRFLARSVLAIMNTDLPRTRVFHAAATGYSGIIGTFAKHITRRPLIVTEHGIYTNERRIELAVAEWIYDSGKRGYSVDDGSTELKDIWLQAFTAFSRTAYELADVITTQYKANQKFQLTDGAPEEKLRIIPNGINVDQYAAIERPPGERPPTVLLIGRVVPIKDTRTYIMAIATLKEQVPEVAAIVIGPENEDPEYARSCRDLVAQLGLENTLQFLSRVPDIAVYLAIADVIVLTSISEAQPIALLEAAAAGLPAVTTDVGSCREIVEGFADDPVKGTGGIVVEPCNPEAIAKALATILRDSNLRKSMGHVMRERVANYYHRDRIRRLYEDMYMGLDTQNA